MEQILTFDILEVAEKGAHQSKSILIHRYPDRLAYKIIDCISHMKIQQTTDALISNWTGMTPSTTLDLLPVRLAYSLSNFHFWYFLLSAIINANRRIIGMNLGTTGE